MTWQSIGVRYVLKSNVGKVMQCMVERFVADKWQLGNLIALEAQPLLKCYPRNCMSSHISLPGVDNNSNYSVCYAESVADFLMDAGSLY